MSGAARAAKIALLVSLSAGCVADHRVAVEQSCLFGAYTKSVGTPGDAGERNALAALEQSVGRPLDLDRIFHQWDDAVPGDREHWTLLAGRTPLVSFNGRGATITTVAASWRAVAAGQEDAHLGDVADGFRALNARVFCIFHHEPDTDTPGFGTPADFRDAYRHVVTLFRQRGAANVTWIFNLKSPSYASLVDAYYPGDDYVDWIGANAYNFGANQSGGRWLSLTALLTDFHNWASPHDRPLIVTEWASVEDPNDPMRKALWLADASNVITSWPDIRAMSYFDAGGNALDSSPQSLAAFEVLAADGRFQPRPQDHAPARP